MKFSWPEYREKLTEKHVIIMSTSHCFRGRPNTSYTPSGVLTKLSIYHVYESRPQNGASIRGNVVFFPDAFGLANHNLALADRYAANGYVTTLLDYFEGDALPISFMGYIPGSDLNDYPHLTEEDKEAVRKVDMPAWLEKHNPQKLAGQISGFMSAYRSSIQMHSTESLHVLGHCFGGKYALWQAKEDFVTSALAVHPSFLDQSGTQNLTRPVFVGCAESDMITPSLITDLVDGLRGAAVPYKIAIYGGTQHGFGSRRDDSTLVADRAHTSCLEDTLRWMEESSTYK